MPMAVMLVWFLRMIHAPCASFSARTLMPRSIPRSMMKTPGWMMSQKPPAIMVRVRNIRRDEPSACGVTTNWYRSTH